VAHNLKSLADQKYYNGNKRAVKLVHLLPELIVERLSENVKLFKFNKHA
jgi:hypothetical protein